MLRFRSYEFAIDTKSSGMARAFKNKTALVVVLFVASVLRVSGDGKREVWVVSWSASQQLPEPHNAVPPEDLQDATVRQIFHLSIGGAVLRVHLSNAFGTQALHFVTVHIARPVTPASAAIDPQTDKALTFFGLPDVTVPPGADYISDPIEYPVAALSDIAVSSYLTTPPAMETGHPGSRATSYFVHRNLVSAAELAEAKHVEHW